MHYLYTTALVFAFLLLLPIWMIWDNSRRIRNATEAAAKALTGNSTDKKAKDKTDSAIYPASPSSTTDSGAVTSNGTDNSDNVKIKLYTAFWCGYCKKLAKEWNKLEEMCKDGKVVINGKTIQTMKFECGDPADEKRVMKDLVLKSGEKFEGFPTITLQFPKQRDETVVAGYDINAENFLKSLKDKI